MVLLASRSRHAGAEAPFVTLLRSSLALLALCIYPIVFVWPALNSGSHVVLLGYQQELTDVFGAVTRAYGLQQMQSPFDRQLFTGYPIGDSIWRWQDWTQAVQTLVLFPLAKTLSPFAAVSGLVLLAWTFSGFCAYFLARNLGATRIVGLIAGVTSQILPMNQVNAANYISYLFYGLPLLSLAFLMKWRRDGSKIHLAAMAGSLLITAFVDGYLFEFSMLSVAVYAIVSSQRRLEIRLTALALIVVVCGLIAYTFYVEMNEAIATAFQGQEGETSRPLVFSSSSNTQGASLFDSLVPHPGHLLRSLGLLQSNADATPTSYLGITVALMVVFVLASKNRLASGKEFMSLSLVAFALLLLTIPALVSLGGFQVSGPAELARQFMPGIQYFSRAAIIAHPILVVVGVTGFLLLLTQRATRWRRVVAAGLTISLLLLDLWSLTQRQLSISNAEYRSLRTAVQQREDAVVLAIPERFVSRSWMAQAELGVPFANSLYTESPFDQIREVRDSPRKLRCLLSGIGVTHLLVAPELLGNEHRSLLEQLQLDPAKAKASVDGYEKGLVDLELYEVNWPHSNLCAHEWN